MSPQRLNPFILAHRIGDPITFKGLIKCLNMLFDRINTTDASADFSSFSLFLASPFDFFLPSEFVGVYFLLRTSSASG